MRTNDLVDQMRLERYSHVRMNGGKPFRGREIEDIDHSICIMRASYKRGAKKISEKSS